MLEANSDAPTTNHPTFRPARKYPSAVSGPPARSRRTAHTAMAATTAK